MHRITMTIALAGLLLAGAGPAGAEVVQILGAAGDVQFHIWSMASPVPGFCYWDQTVAEGGSFHATEADGDGSYCEHAWLAHCDGDSLRFEGVWSEIDGEFLLGIEYQVTLTCEVLLEEMTHLEASRSFTAGLWLAEHSLTLTLPDETVVPILGAGVDDDTVELDLEPGTYGVELRVNAEDGTDWPAYAGEVVLRWSLPDGTPVESESWGSVRARFR